MHILLFGTSNVGKSTTARVLAQKLGYTCVDMDEEVKKRLHTTLEIFTKTGTLKDRDKIRCSILGSVLSQKHNVVMAITPIAYTQYLMHYLAMPDVLAIELQDTPENIFDRLVFSDENDRVYTDDAYKNKYKSYYIREIQKDILAYAYPFRFITNKFRMNGDSPEDVADRLISTYSLKTKA